MSTPEHTSALETPDNLEAETIAVQEKAGAVTGRTDTNDAAATPEARPKRSIKWPHLVAFGLLPALALLLAGTAGWLKWLDSSVVTQGAMAEPVAAAKDATAALLSYQADTVEEDLLAAQDRLTGEFKDSYLQLANEVVIPGSKEQGISAVATVPAAAPVSATPKQVVVLLFVNQTVVVGNDPPTDTSSVVRVSMEKLSDRWLVSDFEAI